MDHEKKNSTKILTTDDIRRNAGDWTLAGDVGLLAHLEEFSENISNKTQETQKYFNEVLENYEEVYTKVGNITNQFLALQNCQFVENRVYDEETPTEEKQEVKEENEAEQEKLLLKRYKEAVEVGVKLLDTHFQEVQLPPNSDSEEDELSAGNSVIWRAKNPYANKKFPLLIGSAEWWADDSIGLVNHKDNLDTERIMSESESDAESIKSLEKKPKSLSSLSMENVKVPPGKPTFLESSSEDLFGLEKNGEVKNAPSDDEFSVRGDNPVSEPINFLSSLESEVQEEPVNNIPENATKPPMAVDNAFTRELMAKLVTVKGEKGEKPAGPPPAKPEASTEGSIFDETDDSNDLFSGSLRDRPAGEKGLFFDAENEDELFAGSNNLFSDSRSDLFKRDASNNPGTAKKSHETVGEPKVAEKKEPIVPKRNLVEDLFEDLDDGDTLFAPRPSESLRGKSEAKKADMALGGEFNWENDDGLFGSINKGEDDFLTRPGFLQGEAKKDTGSEPASRPKEKKEETVGPPNAGNTESEAEDVAKKGKPTVEETNRDVRAGSSPYSKPPLDRLSGILGEYDDDDDDDDLFSGSWKDEKKTGKATGFLDEQSSSLFLEKPKLQDSLSISSSRSSLFDDAPASKSRLASVFDNREKSTRAEEDLFSVSDDAFFAGDPKAAGRDLFRGKAKREEKGSLFGDSDDDEDLFGSAKDTDVFGGKSLFEKPRERGDGDKVIEAKVAESKSEVFAKNFADNFLAEEDLFGAPVRREEKEKTPPKKPKDIFSSTRQSLFGEESGDGSELLFAAGEPKPKPPSSLSIKPQEEPKPRTVGKLNIPGNLKSRLETIQAKQISPGGGTKQEEEKAEETSEPSEPLPNLLKCPSRDRVRIPAGRRPQSRRARREAIRNSDAQWEEASSNKATDAKDTGAARISSPVASNPLSPSTDEEDFFNVPELDTNLEDDDQGLFKSSLFQSAKSSQSEDNLLFDSAPVLSPLSQATTAEAERKPGGGCLFSPEKNKTGRSIFEDYLDGDNDGGGGGENLFTGEELQKAVSRGQQPAESVKASLFDDGDDDNDDDNLFGGSPTPAPRRKVPEAGKADVSEYKEKKSQAFVDPLGLMSSDE